MKEKKLAIAEVLKKKSISQYALAKKLNVPAHHVTQMVKDSYNPTFKTLKKIAEAIPCKVADLIQE